MLRVEVVDYRQSWPQAFRSEAEALQAGIGFLNPDIHHVGSTAVPGLSAKPIIDILIEVDELGKLENHISILADLGYLCRGENGIPGRLYFEKGGDDRTHQIHVFKRGSRNALRHIAFRDYLRHHPQIAREYALLKKQVARECNHDIERYCDGKDSFIKQREQLALAWYSQHKQQSLEFDTRATTGSDTDGPT